MHQHPPDQNPQRPKKPEKKKATKPKCQDKITSFNKKIKQNKNKNY